jgi:phosphocarrier protein HPr
MAAVTCEVVIANALGLHARAAARFVQTAARFDAHIRVARGERAVDGKSLMGVLLLAAARGTTLRIEAEGPEAAGAIEALAGLVSAGFGEGV